TTQAAQTLQSGSIGARGELQAVERAWCGSPASAAPRTSIRDPKLHAVLLESEALVQLMHLGARRSARCDQLVAAELARRGDHFLHDGRAEPAAALRLVHVNVLEQAERRSVQVVGQHIEIRARRLAATGVDREANALGGAVLASHFHGARSAASRLLTSAYA